MSTPESKVSPLRAKIKQKNEAAQVTEMVHLPVSDVDVLVKGMNLGGRLRSTRSEKQGDGFGSSVVVMIALTAHDPESGAPLWNVNDLNDRAEIEALGTDDSDTLTAAALRTSGLDKDDALGKALSAAKASSGSSSASASE